MWRKYTLLWKSQFSTSAWESLVDTIRLNRLWCGENPDIELSFRISDSSSTLSFDPEWLLGRRASSYDLTLQENTLASTAREIHFSCDPLTGLMSHAIEPADSAIPRALGAFAKTPSGHWESGMRALLEFLFVKEPESRAQQDHLRVIGKIRSKDPLASYDRLIFYTQNISGDALDFKELALVNHWAAVNPRFWAIVCGLIGKGGDDRNLILLLCRNWNLSTALNEIS